MNGRCKAKLRSQSGETIAETLIALLISAFALVMLAGAIGTAARIVTQSEEKMQAYYQANNTLATPAADDATVVVKIGSEAAPVYLIDEKVKYSVNDKFSSKPVAAYAK